MTVLSRTGSNSFFFRHFHAIFLFLCWTIVQAVLYYNYGIATDLEAAKYIHEAHNILETGTVTTPNFWLYSTQIFLISAAIKLNTGLFSVYLVQLFFNALATWTLYKFIRRTSNKTTGFLLALVFIFNIPLQTFNSFLQTESLFYSLTILFSCYLLSLQQFTVKNAVLVLLFLFLISFTRPTGVLFIACSSLYLFFRFARALSTLAKIAITIATCIGFFFALNAALGIGGDLDFMLPFRDERIICGVPTLPYFRDIKMSENPNSIYGLFYYITHNTDQFIRLAWLRTKAFFGLSRSYYSNGHNLYLYVYFFPFYLLVLLSIKKWIRQNKYLLLFCFSIIAINWCTVIMSCDDWHNRFFLSVVPYIYILAAPAVQTIADKFKPDDNKRNIQARTI
jgi:hypothetical protein